MSECPECGNNNLAGAERCAVCGRRLATATVALQLPARRKGRWMLVGFVLVAAGIVVFLITRPTDLAPTNSPPVRPGFGAADPKVALTEARLQIVVDALNRWLQAHMSYPELAELLVRDDYLKPTDFDDGWGRRVDYQRLDAQHYRLCSRGPDNLPKTEDDVCLGGRP